ncbi:MAG: 50S ribosomal protein L3 N(5)-glutamine methyltransferase [Agarilytica sp.]
MAIFPAFETLKGGQLRTVLDWLRWGASRFNEHAVYFGHGTDNAWDEAVFLLSHAIHQPWDSLDKMQQAAISEAEQFAVYELFRRRVEERIPAPYLTGVAWFAGLPYKVTQDVLVPRSPIAELILKDLEPWLNKAPRKILDLCTGGGCIGLACAHQFQDADVVLSDVSGPALAVAQQNIDFHGLDARVTTCKSDGFDSIGDATFDLIVSNPPYVDAGDFSSMPQEFHSEPKLGLVSGDDGLDFTRRILKEAGQYLSDDGLLIVEVGNSWPALEAAYPQLSFVWPEFEFGGHGVFILEKAQLAVLA